MAVAGLDRDGDGHRSAPCGESRTLPAPQGVIRGPTIWTTGIEIARTVPSSPGAASCTVLRDQQGVLACRPRRGPAGLRVRLAYQSPGQVAQGADRKSR